MRIDKIATKGDEVYIEYSEQTPAGPNVFTLDCNQRGLPELYHKLNQLSDHVIELMELPDDYTDELQVRTVNFKYVEVKKGGEIMGAIITSVKKLKSGHSVVLNTPFATELPMGGGTNYTGCLSEVCVNVLRGLEIEAQKYINGERVQMELFKKETAKEKRERIKSEKAA